MPENILEVTNLTKTYPSGTAALRGVNLTIRKGEIFGILGVNGAGKSTTLNILIDLITPSGGGIKVFGKDFSKYEEYIKQQMNIATAYADLAANLTVRQNLRVFAMMYAVQNPDRKISELLEQFGITALARQRFDQLSAGQKTRVNLCKSLINDPELLLLDEPTASLDPSAAAHVRQLLLDLQKKRTLTILLTSHNMAEVEQMCNRVALLDKGLIYKIDSPRNLITFLKAGSMEEVFLKLARGETEE